MTMTAVISCRDLKEHAPIMQNNWEAVLELAMDAQRPDAYSSRDPGDPQNAAIRRHAIAVMDAVDRNGLVAPWTAVPHLLALTTDPNRCAQSQAPQWQHM